jgi:hypothetical protein
MVRIAVQGRPPQRGPAGAEPGVDVPTPGRQPTFGETVEHRLHPSGSAEGSPEERDGLRGRRAGGARIPKRVEQHEVVHGAVVAHRGD